MKIRTKPARKWNNEAEHHQYGIYNWFKNYKGIADQNIIKECVVAFCSEHRIEITARLNERALFNYAGNRFHDFSRFATKYLIANNYK